MNLRRWVSNLDVLAYKIGHFVGELSRLVDRAWNVAVGTDDTVADTDAIVVLAKCRSLVNDTCTAVGGNVVIRDDSESRVFELQKIVSSRTRAQRIIKKYLFVKVGEDRLVFQADKIFAENFADLGELGFLGIFVECRQQPLEDDEGLIALFVVDLEVFECRVDTDRQVGWERPWSRGPDKERDGRIVNQGHGNSY
jgi:hypothetical protein